MLVVEDDHGQDYFDLILIIFTMVHNELMS